MAMTINTNISSINAQRNLGLSGGSLATSMQRISSGLRVNSAKDDAAGLAISDRHVRAARDAATRRRARSPVERGLPRCFLFRHAGAAGQARLYGSVVVPRL